MKAATFVLALAAMVGPPIVAAQGFQDQPTCYSWQGGDKSAGIYTKCPQPWVVVAAKPTAPMVAAPVLQAAPVCPPQITVVPEPRKPVIRKPRPKPVQC